MNEPELWAPPFTYLLKTEVRASDNRVDVYVGADDRSAYRLAFAAKIVPALMLELSGRMAQLTGGPESDTATTPVTPRVIHLAVGGDGNPALIVEMDGYETALRMTHDGLAALHRTISRYLSPN